MSDYRIERLSYRTINDLYWLFNTASKSSKTLKVFERKYNTSYTGILYVGFLAYDKNDKPAAFYGIIPTFSFINESKILIAQSTDTFTHPNHQRKGLFTLLAKKTYDLAKELNIEFIYGVPNEKSFPGFIKKLVWNHIDNMHYLIQRF
jgi:GNAT superfamily N-acetyltransferase